MTADTAGFDQYATNYHDELDRGLAVTGESSEYFAVQRIGLLIEQLSRLSQRPANVLDFGCGIGTTTPLLLGIPSVQSLVGTDASLASLEVAREQHRDLPARFVPIDAIDDGSVDLAYCNGVFHHIPPPERDAAVRFVAAALRPGGLFAFWENNPWNPGTRLVMKRIPFDREAQTLSPPASRELLRRAGLEILGTQFAFIFPNALRALRRIERFTGRLPIGGQYMVLARKPAGSVSTAR